MKLLEAEPTQAPAAPGAPADAAPAPARTCAACGAGMAADQDWCLSCGTAAPGRLGQRPGWRAALTVLALTLVLVAGSVAAAYAALTSDATQEAAAPPPPDVSPVAQAAPATPPSSATPPAPKLPKVQAPPSTQAPSSPATPVVPAPAPQPVAPAPPPSSGPGSSGAGAGTDTLPAPVAIKLPSDAGSLYDPSQLATPPPDPALAARALDGKPATAFTITPARPEWGVGYVVDLQKAHGLRTLEITTSTPGFRVEVYATDLATSPPTVTDARWAHLADRKALGADGKPDTLQLDDGSTTYRTLLLWVTKGPAQGNRVALNELKVTR